MDDSKSLQGVEFNRKWGFWGLKPSGVQRVLDARANEVLGCPPKILTTFFSHLSLFSYLKISYDLLSVAPLSYMPTVLTFFLLISCNFKHLPTPFLRKLDHWVPPGWMPGAVAPPSACHC